MGNKFYDCNKTICSEKDALYEFEIDPNDSIVFAIHTFSNLTYQITSLVYSDPRITVFHNTIHSMDTIPRDTIPGFNFLGCTISLILLEAAIIPIFVKKKDKYHKPI